MVPKQSGIDGLFVSISHGQPPPGLALGEQPLVNVVLIMNCSSLLGWGSPLVDTNCHSFVGELAPPRRFISTALVTMDGSPVAGEGVP